MNIATCTICGDLDGREWETREMMFGLRDPFTYFECGGCGCLQLLNVPTDFSRYYPSDYYSLDNHPSRPPGLRGWLRERRNDFAFTGKGVVGRLLHRRNRYPVLGVADWVARTGKGKQVRILDVGCGAGHLIFDLAVAGFDRPLGIDPFIAADIHYPEGASVLKEELDDVTGQFDLIIFNHSLEHIADQVGTLRAVARLLDPQGLCVARMPTASSWAWEFYRTDWVQLDAPRHLMIHTLKSAELTARAAGLSLVEVRYDSDEFQFLGSELYRRDTPLLPALQKCSRREARRYRRRARKLNAVDRGDQASFFFTLN